MGKTTGWVGQQNLIVNVVPDEKFVGYLIDAFNRVCPGRYCFRIISHLAEEKNSLGDASCIYVNQSYLFSKSFVSEAESAELVIFHSLSPVASLAMVRLPKHIKVMWRGWGFDYYKALEMKRVSFLLPETTKMIKAQPFLPRLCRKLSTTSERSDFLAERLAGDWIRRRMIARVNYFSCCVPSDYHWLRQEYPSFKADYVPFNYYSTEDTFLRGGNSQVSGQNILLGNSATPTNNHLEAMGHIASLNLPDEVSIVTPLSYGNSYYREAVILEGSKILDRRFMPLTEYMPLEEYNAITASCSNVIMNHLRQQAIGNVSAALIRGAKVYLRPQNPIYRYFKDMGIKVYSFPTECTEENLASGLDQSSIERNSSILSDYWSRFRGDLEIKEFLDSLV